MSKCLCTVEYLSQLLVCNQPTCTQPSIRCKNCFKYIHRHEDDTHQKKIHSNIVFTNSPLFKNFAFLIKLLEIIKKKAQKNFSALILDIDQLADLIFSSSEILQKDVFSNNDGYCYNQFYAMKELYYGRKCEFGMSPTPEFILMLSRFSVKKFEEIRRILIKNTAQQQLLEYNFNMVSENNTIEIEKFIEQEQNAFYEYCEKFKNEKQAGFDVFAYMKERRASTDKNPTYYSRNFQNFLEEKYSKSPQKQGLFELGEYSRYIWTEFHILSTLPHEQEYLNHWISAYEIYSNYYKEANLQQSVLSFRMWKQYAGKYQKKSQVKNIYYLDNFIISFIDLTIEKKLYGCEFEEYTLSSWSEYKKYIKDFVNVVVTQKEEFVAMSEYKKYYIFRSENEKFIEHIKLSKDIVYNSIVATDYLNETYIKNGKVSLKNYKAYLQKYDAAEQAKILERQTKIQELKKQLMDELGQQKFYPSIFDGFVASAIDQEVQLTKENYYLYRDQVLDKFDQNQIRLENEEAAYDRYILEQQEDVMEPAEKVTEGQDDKIKYNLEVDEEIIHQINAEESSEEEEYGISPEMCPCCKGDPDDCQEEQCQMMGYCVTCSL